MLPLQKGRLVWILHGGIVYTYLFTYYFCDSVWTHDKESLKNYQKQEEYKEKSKDIVVFWTWKITKEFRIKDVLLVRMMSKYLMINYKKCIAT